MRIKRRAAIAATLTTAALHSQQGTVNELAAAEKINSSYASRPLHPALLASDIVAVILDGQPPEGMTLPGLMEQLPVEWGQQSNASSGLSGSLISTYPTNRVVVPAKMANPQADAEDWKC